MIRRHCPIAYLLAVAVLVGATYTAHGADKTVYEMADGVVRPSALNGAQEAYFPIIVNSSHASNLLALPNGDLLCFWFAGTWEGRAGVSIVMSRLDHGANRWTLPVVLSNHPGRSDQNPVPFRAPDGRLWLFHTSQIANQGETNSVIYRLTSDDQGHTWTSPQLLFTEPGSFDRQHLVVFHDEWLFPTEIVASGDIITHAQNDRTIVKVSTNSGESWSGCEVPGSGGLVQMNIVPLSEKHFIAFFRSRYADWVYKSDSTDGCHWSVPGPSQLPNNNSSIQVTRLKDGHLAIAFNNTQATTTRGEPRTAPRNILSVALSVDGGNTWPWVRDVQPGNEPPTFRACEVAEYSYPSIIQTADGMLRLTFTFRRETVKYMTFEEQWIKEGTTEGVFKGDPKP